MSEQARAGLGDEAGVQPLRQGRLVGTATSARPARHRHATRSMPLKPEVVRLVYDKYTVGSLSIGAIARLLRGMGVPTRRRVRWERSVVWAILRNPAYKGTACFNKTQTGPRQKVTKPFRVSGRGGQ